jgi:hypothetical protein
MPGVLAYTLESTQAGKSAKMQLIIMTTAVGSILFIFQKYSIWTIEVKIHDATKVIQRALQPSCLGRGSAILEISIAASAGLNTIGNAKTSTTWFPGNMK